MVLRVVRTHIVYRNNKSGATAVLVSSKEDTKAAKEDTEAAKEDTKATAVLVSSKEDLKATTLRPNRVDAPRHTSSSTNPAMWRM